MIRKKGWAFDPFILNAGDIAPLEVNGLIAADFARQIVSD
jgi:hypothetical protein